MLVWRDLNDAFACVTANQDNFDFWLRIRTIFLDWTDGHINEIVFIPCQGKRGCIKTAHWAFLVLSDIFSEVHFGRGGHNLEWFHIPVWDACMVD